MGMSPGHPTKDITDPVATRRRRRRRRRHREKGEECKAHNVSNARTSGCLVFYAMMVIRSARARLQAFKRSMAQRDTTLNDDDVDGSLFVTDGADGSPA